MSTTMDPALARRLWLAAEPLHAVVYFAPETTQAAKDAGLKGFWMAYFAGRAAPMGPVAPGPVEATFFNFHPSMVRRAIPDAWSFCTPERVHRARLGAVVDVLRRLLPGDEAQLAPVADLADRACEDLDCSGRPLAAAWHEAWEAGREEGGVLARLWLACTVLREHRGDGHVAALVAQGLSGCQAHVLAVATGRTPREAIQPNRGWTDEDWQAAAEALRERGWLDADGTATEAGRVAREAVERRTDELALAPLRALPADDVEPFLDELGRLADAVRAADAIPFPNPIGLPR